MTATDEGARKPRGEAVADITGATSYDLLDPAMTQPIRCSWARTPLSIAYHDVEWGVPVHDDRVLFEFLMLEGAQAELS